MPQLIGSVGRGGLNRKVDVRLIQGLLNNYKIPHISIPLIIDGDAGNTTFKRIETFQSKILNKKHPSGHIEPDDQTFKKLDNKPGSKAASALTLSPKGTNLLHIIEGLTTTPYDDQTGEDISHWVQGATIGYGHLISRRNWSLYKDGMTKTDAAKLFKKDLAPFEEKIHNSVTRKITQNEFDALLILIFNIGRTAFGKSSVLKLVNNPSTNTSFASLHEAWMAWNKSQGKRNQGLINRRTAEWNIYSKNIYKRW